MSLEPLELDNELAAIEKEIYEAIKLIVLKREGILQPDKGDQLPPVDVYICDQYVEVEVELPGVSRDDVEISYINQFLSIKGVKRKPSSCSKIRYHCMESSFGRFRRLIEIPTAININRAKAKLKDGILTISLPRVSERREIKKTIDIE